MSGRGNRHAGMSGNHAARMATIAVAGGGWNRVALLALYAVVAREAA